MSEKTWAAVKKLAGTGSVNEALANILNGDLGAASKVLTGKDGIGVGPGKDFGKRFRRFVAERIQIDSIIHDRHTPTRAPQIHPAKTHQDRPQPEKQAFAVKLGDPFESPFHRPNVKIVRRGRFVGDQMQGNRVQTRTELGKESAGPGFRVVADVFGNVHASAEGTPLSI